GKRYWARVCNGLMEELRAQVGEKVLAMYAAHSLGAGNAQLSDLLARAFPQPKGEVLRAACEALKAKGGI
ncbi:MAG: hypothetical protein Q8P48_11015, partial [Deltaproteobacteria bacterium]|nr:hypothetical protein [Deltaproteobacteria bacterium]